MVSPLAPKLPSVMLDAILRYSTLQLRAMGGRAGPLR